MFVHHPDHDPEDLAYYEFVEPLDDVDVSDAPELKDAPDETD
jgi:hypothetical protein